MCILFKCVSRTLEHYTHTQRSMNSHTHTRMHIQCLTLITPWRWSCRTCCTPRQSRPWAGAAKWPGCHSAAPTRASSPYVSSWSLCAQVCPCVCMCVSTQLLGLTFTPPDSGAGTNFSTFACASGRSVKKQER